MDWMKNFALGIIRTAIFLFVLILLIGIFTLMAMIFTYNPILGILIILLLGGIINIYKGSNHD